MDAEIRTLNDPKSDLLVHSSRSKAVSGLRG
jgi:hypothetical protein